MTTVVFDIEADGFLEDISKIHCISLSVDGTDPVCFTNSKNALAFLSKADTIVGHNIIGYDLPVLRKLCSWEPEQRQVIRDTLPLSRIVWPDIINKDMLNCNIPKKYWGRYSLRAFGHRMDMHKGDIECFDFFSQEMVAYCNQDVRITNSLYALIKKIGVTSEAAKLEIAFALLAQEMYECGIQFNTTKAIELYDTLLVESKECMTEVKDLVPPKVEELRTPEYWTDELTGVQYNTKSSAPCAAKPDLKRGPNKIKITAFNPLSRPQVGAYLKSCGWKPEKLTTTGRPQVNEGVLLSIKDIPAAAVLAKLYRVNKLIAMLAEGKEAWIKLEDDGRIHPKIKPMGTVSGRTSCVRPNLQQVPSPRLAYGKECRELFCARPGYVLVGCDAKSLEVRCFAHYISKYDGGEFSKQVVAGDIHQDNADLMKCDRQTAKNTFFALIYGASPTKISTMLDVDLVQAENLIDTLFRKRPEMQYLIAGIKRAAQSRGFLRGLDGRKLIPRSVHSSVNLLIQAAGACVAKQAAINMREYIVDNKMGCLGIRIVGFIHDEILIEAPEHNAGQLLMAACRSFRETTTQFNLRCPMDGEGSIGETWYEVH